MGYIIDLCGELTEVELSFFSRIKIVRHDTIGDVHFIRLNDITFSIHNNVWYKVQIDLRNNKIDDIIS